MTKLSEQSVVGNRATNGPATNNHKLLAAEHGLVIDAEFRALCPMLSPDESAQLERSLVAEGCRDDVVAWQATKDILDGYNRHPVCDRLGLPFGVVFLDLPDRDACKRWIRANQLARRNLSSQAASYFRGTQYLLEKQGQGGNHTNDEATSHGETLEASKRLADEYRVARATIFRDATFARAVDKIVAACGPVAKDIILARDSEITRRTVLLLAKMTADLQQQAIEELIENGKLPSGSGEGKKATISLPREPKALAEKLINRLGTEACRVVVAQLKKLLRGQKGARNAERGVRNSECGGGENSFNPEPSATAPAR
ncbi:MAG TPA: hypothetical protein VGX76_16500 [Pirellulales bacterium]|nr:hypothetical protein [Pirellulales bacterium]